MSWRIPAYDTAPDFTLANVYGNAFNLRAGLENGHVVLVFNRGLL